MRILGRRRRRAQTDRPTHRPRGDVASTRSISIAKIPRRVRATQPATKCLIAFAGTRTRSRRPKPKSSARSPASARAAGRSDEGVRRLGVSPQRLRYPRPIGETSLAFAHAGACRAACCNLSARSATGCSGNAQPRWRLRKERPPVAWDRAKMLMPAPLVSAAPTPPHALTPCR